MRGRGASNARRGEHLTGWGWGASNVRGDYLR